LKLFKILEVQWNFKSQDIISIKKRMYRNSVYIIEVQNFYNPVEINSDVFNLFKKDFPEWCVNIEEEQLPF